MDKPLRVSAPLLKRLARVSQKAGVSPRSLAEKALGNQLDYEEWFLKAVDEGLADLAARRVHTTDEIIGALERQRANRGARRGKSAA